MLVDLDATRLSKNRAVQQLAELHSSRGSRLRLTATSREVDTIISLCSKALTQFNPDARSADFETVYQVKDDFISIGVLYEGNLIKSYDSAAICDQLHLDNSMAIFTRHKKAISMGKRFDNLMMDIPNTLQYDDLYYSPTIFAEFIVNNSKAPDFIHGDQKQLAHLIDMVHRSSFIVKGREKLSSDEVDLLNDLINTYGAFIAGKRYSDYDVPDKYVISKKWFDKIQTDLGSNPFFIFRHVWRCYFRLCKEGYRFNG